MKVFLSWSKTRSKRVAELLGEWIPCVIQSIEPWVSSQNIEDGELWFSAIQTQIGKIINGVICLTQENKSEPWVLFEAGGLARGLEKNRVYILLIDLKSEDILLSPLAGFNHTRPDEEGIRKLIGVINSRTDKPVPPQLIDKAFVKFWPDFQTQFNTILDETKVEEKTEFKRKTITEVENDIKPLLEEILKNVRSKSDNSPKLINPYAVRREIRHFATLMGWGYDETLANCSAVTVVLSKTLDYPFSPKMVREEIRRAYREDIRDRNNDSTT